MTFIQSETEPLSDLSPNQPDHAEDPANKSKKQQEILTFWFGSPIAPDDLYYKERRKLWFGKSESVDQTILSQFRDIYESAKAGNCKAWQATPQGCLSLIVLLDQFPRNMFRGTPDAFATDHKALKVTQRAIAQGFDQELLPVQRMFIYLPLEHSENRDHQQQAVTLFQALADEHQELNDTYIYALKHQSVIERFGRFPHRNEILARSSTPEELEFLKQPGSSF